MRREPTVGLLYPTPDSGEDDFVELAASVHPAIKVDVIYFPWPDVVEDLAALNLDQLTDAVRRLGSRSHLERVLPAAMAGHRVDAVVFAVTSSSFLHGADGVQQQLATIRQLTARPATSTTAAFQQAIRHLELHTVALASVYAPRITDHFIERLNDVGVNVIRRVDASARSDRELAEWSPQQIVDLVREASHPEARAVLLPETALHASTLNGELERAAGCPVLTATQVSLWAAAQLIEVDITSTTHGPLFLT